MYATGSRPSSDRPRWQGCIDAHAGN